MARTKQHVSHFAFGTGLRLAISNIIMSTLHLCFFLLYCTTSRAMSMDYTKPLLVPAGSDALGQIGKLFSL